MVCNEKTQIRCFTPFNSAVCIAKRRLLKFFNHSKPEISWAIPKNSNAQFSAQELTSFRSCTFKLFISVWGRILVQVTIYRRLLIGRDGHLDQSEAYDISQLVREYGPRVADKCHTDQEWAIRIKYYSRSIIWLKTLINWGTGAFRWHDIVPLERCALEITCLIRLPERAKSTTQPLHVFWNH